MRNIYIALVSAFILTTSIATTAQIKDYSAVPRDSYLTDAEIEAIDKKREAFISLGMMQEGDNLLFLEEVPPTKRALMKVKVQKIHEISDKQKAVIKRVGIKNIKSDQNAMDEIMRLDKKRQDAVADLKKDGVLYLPPEMEDLEGNYQDFMVKMMQKFMQYMEENKDAFSPQDIQEIQQFNRSGDFN